MSETLRPVFITGLPRSGTTWASRALVAATEGRLVHEPFNWKRYPDRVDYHMRYVPAGATAPDLLAILQRALKPRLPFLARFLPDRRAVIKDVHICLALPFVWDHLHPLVIILMRHPCAVADSWHRLDLEVRFRLDLLLSQKTLHPFLAPYVGHMRRNEDYFFALGAYWGASHFVLREIAAAYPQWQWVTHEWLCIDSARRFRQLLDRLDVTLSAKGRDKLARFIDKNDRKRTTQEGPYSLARLSEGEPEKWKRSLTEAQQEAVLAGAEPFGMVPVWASLRD